MQGHVKAVFWDMDGTLIDSEDVHYEVIRDWCAGHGLELTLEDNVNLTAKTMQEKWRLLAPRLGATANEQLFRRECEDWYIERVTREQGIDAAIEIALKLGEQGIVQGCVSNGEEAVVRANIKVLGVDDIFSFQVSGVDVEQGKPAPDPYLLAAKKAGCEPGECIAVEDSIVGITAARSAGVIVCGWPKKDIPDLDVDHFLTSGADFPFSLIG